MMHNRVPSSDASITSTLNPAKKLPHLTRYLARCTTGAMLSVLESGRTLHSSNFLMQFLSSCSIFVIKGRANSASEGVESLAAPSQVCSCSCSCP